MKELLLKKHKTIKEKLTEKEMTGLIKAKIKKMFRFKLV
jgi:hypothetical protein